MRLLALLVSLVALVALVACGPAATATPTPAPTSTATPAPTATPVPTSTPTTAPTATATPVPVAASPTPAGTSTAGGQTNVTPSVANVTLGKSDALGSFLTDGAGRTLYLYTKDEANLSNCYNQCAVNWPPLLTSDKPTAGDGVVATLLGTTQRTDGATQVTYNGWPLYYYAKDAKAGDTTGQNVGKVWFVVTADGAAVQADAPVKLGKNDTLGSFLMDASGRALYLYTKDTLGTSNCYDACAQRWPPLITTGAPVAGDGAVQALLGATQRKDGSMQVTYNGWPLYYYAKDAKPGDTAGQNVGKVWFVVTADGAAVQNAAAVKAGNSDLLGAFIVDAAGRALYLYTKDQPGVSNCYDACAQKWPPLLTVGAPTAGEGSTAALLGTATRKDGSTQVTYNGWPLYYYYKDAKPGDTSGQNVGKVWFVITPDGKQVDTAPAAPTTAAPTATPVPAAPPDNGYDYGTSQPGAAFTPGTADAPREIDIMAMFPKFDPNQIEVKAGETVRFVVTSSDVFHTFTIGDLGVDLGLDGGKSASVVVTIPSGKSEIPFFCDPHQGNGMTGKLVVVP